MENYISGIVIRGQMLGRKLGFPTANLRISPETPLPVSNGVYAVRVLYSENVYLGMANIGTRPTVDGNTLTVEVNLFDFEGDLYGESLSVYFIRRIRDEKKFDSLEALTQEIRQDKIKILKLFSRLGQADPDS